MNCPKCQQPISENQTVCYSCGARLEEASSAAQEPVRDELPEQLPPQPPKKSKLPVIVIIVAAVVLTAAAGIFVAVNLPADQNGGTSPKNAATTNATAQTETAKRARTLPELVESYEQALNNNDKDAMTELFAPSLRDKKSVETAALTFFNNLIGQSGQKLIYDFELLDDIDYAGEDKATGKVKISAELPIVGLQSTQTTFSFLMEGGEWYIAGII